MRKLVIFLCLIAVALSSPLSVLVTDKFEGTYNTGVQFTQWYMNEEWDEELDFGVYYWLKINSQYAIPGWATMFTLTSNADNNLRDAAGPGDRVISGFVRGCEISTCTYSNGNGNHYQINHYDTKKDVDKWAFYYQGFSASKKRITTFIEFESTLILAFLDGVENHRPSTYYKMIVGQSFGYGYFPGTLWRIVLQGGGNIYRETNFKVLKNEYNPKTPPANCIQIYEQPYYKGPAINGCQKIPKLDINSIKSIYIPNGAVFNLYGSENYSGKVARITQSYEVFPPINKLPWKSTSFIQKNHSLTSSKKNLKRMY